MIRLFLHFKIRSYLIFAGIYSKAAICVIPLIACFAAPYAAKDYPFNYALITAIFDSFQTNLSYLQCNHQIHQYLTC